MIDHESLQNLEKLHQLKTDGVITEEDFEAAKQRMLRSPPRAADRPVTRSSDVSLPDDGDHLSWILKPLKRYADFNGRSCRKEFWMFQLIYVALFFGTVIIVAADTKYGEIGTLGNLTLLLAVLAALGLAVPLLAVEVRRFHDQDMSGWFALLNLIPYLGPFVVMVFMLIDGTAGENRFGTDPKRD